MNYYLGFISQPLEDGEQGTKHNADGNLKLSTAAIIRKIIIAIEEPLGKL